jgi:50S ribosomal subunit-associated GTPase HflX
MDTKYIVGMANINLEERIRQACSLAKNRHGNEEKRISSLSLLLSEKSQFPPMEKASLEAVDLEKIYKMENIVIVNRVDKTRMQKIKDILQTRHGIEKFISKRNSCDTHLKRLSIIQKMKKNQEKLNRRREKNEENKLANIEKRRQYLEKKRQQKQQQFTNSF